MKSRERKRKILFNFIFFIEIELLAISVGLLSTVAGMAMALAPVVAVGGIFAANCYMKEFFDYSDLERVAMQFMFGVMELLAALLIVPHTSLLVTFYVVVPSFSNYGFIVVAFSLFVVSIFVMVISLFRMWRYKKHEY